MRCLLKLFGGSSVFLEKPLEQRRNCASRARNSTNRHLSQAQAVIRESASSGRRPSESADGECQRCPPAAARQPPTHARSAICAIEASRRLVGIHRAAAILTLDANISSMACLLAWLLPYSMQQRPHSRQTPMAQICALFLMKRLAWRKRPYQSVFVRSRPMGRLNTMVSMACTMANKPGTNRSRKGTRK